MAPAEDQPRRYFSSRTRNLKITALDAHWRLQNLFVLYRDRDYFKERLSLREHHTPSNLAREAIVHLGFTAFPISTWTVEDTTEDHIFDVLEFLYDRVSKPGSLVNMWQDGIEYQDYENYDEAPGRQEFRAAANLFLADLGDGFELGEEGQIRALGAGGLQHILKAEIVPFDEVNVDRKVVAAIERWRSRHATLDDKKEAVRIMADVFEWLKDNKQLGTVLDRKDESDLFNIANSFAIRHHEPSQKVNYDRGIWYNWMFHFYLATYHAAIRLLVKKQKVETKAIRKPQA